MTRVNSVIKNVKDLEGRSRSHFEFDHSQHQFRCLAELGGDVLALTTSGSDRPMRMVKMGEGGGFISSTVTLVNNSCESLRYQISDSGKHVVEEVIMGILSVIPTFGIDKISQAPRILKKATKIAERISAGLTLKSM